MSHGEREVVCPNCGSPLVVSVEKNRKGEFLIRFWCDGDYDDQFNFAILTHLTNDDLETLEEGKTVPKQMDIKLIERKEIPEWERE
jgi:hypothetical protein